MTDSRNVALPGSWTYESYVAPHDRAPRQAGRVTIILARPEAIPQFTEQKQALEIEGDSHLAICRPAVEVDSPTRGLTFQTSDNAGRSITFRGDANSGGHLGKVHIHGLPFSDIRQCESAGMNLMQPTMALLSYNNDIPIFVWQVHVAPAGSDRTYVRMPEQFFQRHNGNRQHTFPREFELIVPSYREALNLVQISPLLSFALFYRVIEATSALRRPPLRNEGRAGQRIPQSWPDICTWLSDLLGYTHIDIAGAHEVVTEEAVGKKYSWIIGEQLRPLRNRILHGLIDDPAGRKKDDIPIGERFSSIDDPELQIAVQQWLPLCHVVARSALRDSGGLERVELGEPAQLALESRVERERATRK